MSPTFTRIWDSLDPRSEQPRSISLVLSVCTQSLCWRAASWRSKSLFSQRRSITEFKDTRYVSFSPRVNWNSLSILRSSMFSSKSSFDCFVVSCKDCFSFSLSVFRLSRTFLSLNSLTSLSSPVFSLSRSVIFPYSSFLSFSIYSLIFFNESLASLV